MSWVIVEAPHPGLLVPAECLAEMVLPAHAIGRDADLYVDALYQDAPDAGASLLTTPFSRYVVDLNRSEEDVDASSVLGVRTLTRAPRGILWTLSGEREPVLAEPLLKASFTRRLERYYRPYHQRLSELITERHAKFGRVLVLAVHSMPSTAGGVRKGRLDLESARADVVPGTRGRTSAAPIYIDALDHFFKSQNLDVRHDIPYAGGFTTTNYGKPQEGVHVIQIELARRLYMDETTLLPKPADFEKLRVICSRLVQTMAVL
jgi:N-formylglutamate deformylase